MSYRMVMVGRLSSTFPLEAVETKIRRLYR